REGLDQIKLEKQRPRAGELPFDPGRKRMSVFFRGEKGQWVVVVKGAPDVLLGGCAAGPGGPLSDEVRRLVLEANEAMARKALRVIAVARRELDRSPEGMGPEELERELTFLGLFGLSDPP